MQQNLQHKRTSGARLRLGQLHKSINDKYKLLIHNPLQTGYPDQVSDVLKYLLYLAKLRDRYQQGTNDDYDCEHAVDLTRLLIFIQQIQPKTFDTLGFVEDGSKRTRFLHRLQGEIAKRNVR